MLQAALLLLVLTNAAWRERVHRVDAIEVNRLPSGSVQIIAWECRPNQSFPVDWVIPPCGHWNGEFWIDDAGFSVRASELRATVTDHDPERRAAAYWAKKNPGERQGGIWKR
jgi:hypothetical protein